MAQKYQVLARKYRPQTFAEVIGQEAILKTLRNALKRDAIAHAYLFCGSRGVGKTTLARLFAKALNCASPKNDEPCNECPSCAEITGGQSLDVIEIDGASNRGIDDIRQINETVGFAPSHGKYKIYIIDEVHMLTKEAFNALLKTLEEPPERVKFFFATTEPHKVLPTIISRCQRFDLGRHRPSQIADKLRSIAADLKRPVESEALHLIAQFADGSLRDAESLFDQILCFSGETVTAADVQNALGLSPKDLFFAFDKAFSEQRLSYAFELVAQLFEAGKDLSHFLDQLIEHYRHLAVVKTLGESALSFPQQLAEHYAASSRLYTQPQILAILDLLIKGEPTLAKSASPRVALELLLLQILKLKNRLPVEVLVRRLGELEEKLRSIPPSHLAAEPKAEPAQPEASPLNLIESQAPRQPAEPTEPPSAKPQAPRQPTAEPKVEHEEPSPQLEAAPFHPFTQDQQEPAEPAAPPSAKPQAPRQPAAEPKAEPAQPSPQLKAASPHPTQPTKVEEVESKREGSPPEKKAPPLQSKPAEPPYVSPLGRQAADYETILRFAAVEFEGTVKK